MGTITASKQGLRFEAKPEAGFCYSAVELYHELKSGWFGWQGFG